MAKAQTISRTIPFKTIRARAEKRKGGPKALEKLLPRKPDVKRLAKLSDDRMLAEMTKRVFSAGFAWSVIEAKWEGFEQAFLGFEPAKLAFQPDDFWDALVSDTRIVRNGAKILSVRENAAFVQEIAKEHGSLRQVPFELALSRRNRTARPARQARQPARRQHRTDVAALRRLGWICDVAGCGGVLARRGARYRRGSEVEGRSRQGAGAVQRLGCAIPDYLTCICRASARCRSARTIRRDVLALHYSCAMARGLASVGAELGGRVGRRGAAK